MVCQSIIPGILSFMQQDIISEYGSSNNCKHIDTNEEVNIEFKCLVSLNNDINLQLKASSIICSC